MICVASPLGQLASQPGDRHRRRRRFQCDAETRRKRSRRRDSGSRQTIHAISTALEGTSTSAFVISHWSPFVWNTHAHTRTRPQSLIFYMNMYRRLLEAYGLRETCPPRTCAGLFVRATCVCVCVCTLACHMSVFVHVCLHSPASDN